MLDSMNPTTTRRHDLLPRALGLVSLVALLLAIAPVGAAERRADPDWRPQTSETLIKLPAAYLQKSLDADYSRSELSQAVRGAEDGIAQKLATLADLQKALDRSEGEMRAELRHQVLAEKKAYIDLISRKHALERRHLETRLRVLEQLQTRLRIEDDRNVPARADLISKQDAARQRFQSSLAQVDVSYLKTSVAPESRYAREYGRNLMALETLMSAVRAHPANQDPEVQGQPMNKTEYLRFLIGDAQAGLELLAQGETIVGYMAKLVALDATALSAAVKETETAGEAPPADKAHVTSAVGLFVR